MNTVKEMLEIKGREVWSIEASQSVYQAIEMMEEMGVGALTVLDDARLAGIVSERDFARKVILKNKSSTETSVADIMTRDVVTVGEETTIDRCMLLMSQKKIRHLPVMDGETPVGMITVGDLLKVTIKEQSTTIEELESYIMDETGGEG
ncbi:MAG: CBS domain-containing protein [Proteobacteria bacterium]|nr:CBS domain-containing protein [Pseudomonadota bacterium]